MPPRTMAQSYGLLGWVSSSVVLFSGEGMYIKWKLRIFTHMPSPSVGDIYQVEK